ncbi:MAG: AsmA family protein [Methylobacteriaceae bacterium]|nr:AsmA family protein [Methylobacteriaceae bacterium]
MRESLTILAVLVVLALTAALVGPYFVDWSAQRSLLEAKLSEALGTPVRVGGAIDLRLLPSPRLSVGQVSTGSPGREAPVFAADKVRLELAVAGLVRGDFVFTDATFEGLRAKVSLADRGRLALPEKSILAQHKLQFDNLAVRRGTFTIDAGAGGPSYVLENVALDAQASSLLGPFKGTGSAHILGRQIAFRFSTGAVERERLRLKLLIDEAAGVPRTELDGALLFPRPDASGPAKPIGYEGTVVVSGTIGSSGAASPTPWRLSGKVTADPQKAVLDGLDLHVGAEERQMSASVTGEIDLGAAPQARLSLAAKQLDLDRLLGGDGPARPLDVVALLGPAFAARAPGGELALPLRLDCAIGLVSLGGEPVTDVAMSLSVKPGEPIAGRLEATAPGRSHLVADGTLETGAAAAFNGRIELATRDNPRLAAWLGHDDPAVAAAIAAYLPFKSVDITANAEISGVGFAARDLSAKLDRSSLAGALVLTEAVGQDHARLFADLTSDTLDIDALPDLNLETASAGELDLAVHIVAQAVKIARVGEAAVNAGRIEVQLGKTGDDTRLDRLTIAGLGGASVEASGVLNAQGGRLDATLDAAQLAGFADLLRHVMPGRVVDALTRRAAPLSPAKIALRIETAPGGSLTNATLDGTAGETKVTGSLRRDGKDGDGIVVNLSLETADVARLFQQIGSGAIGGRDAGDGRLAFAAQGHLGAGLDATLDANLAGTELSWRGRIDLGRQSADGAVTATSSNVLPLLRAFGLTAPEPSPTIDVEFAGDLAILPDRILLHRLKGSLAGIAAGGEAALFTDFGLSGDDASDPSPRLKGTLSVDRLPAPLLGAFAFGLPQASPPDGSWSKAKFAPAISVPFETDLDLNIGRLDFGPGIDAGAATMRLGFRPAMVTFTNASLALDGGTISGAATLRRDGAVATIAGHADLAALSFDRPFAAGTLAARVDFAGTGDSPDALVGGLAGQGTVSIAGVRLPGLDADALTRIVGAADAERLPIEEDAVRRALAAESDRAGRSLVRLDLPAAIAAGVIRLGPASLPDPRASISTIASIDIKARTIDMNTDMRLETAPRQWTGTPPQITVTWAGPLPAPKRDIDASSFFNGLSARALSINLQRLEALDADIRERAFFNRRLKAIEADEEREREHAASAQEEARRHFEQDRRRAEAKAAEAQRQAADAARAEDARRKTGQSKPSPGAPPPTAAAPGAPAPGD